MSSSFLVFGDYAPHCSAEWSTRLQVQLRTWLPVLVCAMVFAVESTSYLGADRTSDPLQRVVEVILGYDVCVYWDLIHHIIRKTGHFMGYGLFSLVCFRAFWITLQSVELRLMRQFQAHGLAILATFLVASADEFHQSFLPNRTGQFSDVLLDCFGSVALGLALFLIMHTVKHHRQARAKTRCRLEPVYSSVVA